jgi:hypothetical protein
MLSLKKMFPILLVALVMLSACSGSKKNKVGENSYIYELKRGACFGKCPVFEIKIKEDGTAFLDAKMFNPVNGKLEKKLSKAEFSIVKKLFEEAKLTTLPDEYPTMVADLPITILTQNINGNVKKVKSNEKMPVSYEKAVEMMETLAKSEGWTLIEKYEDTKPVIEPESRENSTIFEEIIIEPNPGIRLPAWFKEMESYGVRLIKKVSTDQNLWLITYDTKTYNPTMMLDVLKNDKSIKNASFNKRTELRK